MTGVKAFSGCSRLDKVCLSNGLEKIGSKAFLSCSSLRFIDIPSTVKDIHPRVFFNCRAGLVKVDFCDNILEQFLVSGESLRVWWNQGASKLSLKTYCFLIRCSIPSDCIGALTVRKWQVNIHSMLKHIPSMIAYDEIDNCYDRIDTKLAAYEWLNDVLTLFELAASSMEI